MRHTGRKPDRGTGAVTAIGRWSARHPWPAIALWLAFVVACVGALAVTGSKGLQSGAAGESARAESMLRQHQARPGQDEFAYLHSDTLRTDQPAFRAAIAKVASSMEDALGGRVTTSVSAGGHSALVTGPIGRPFSTDALAAAVAAAGGTRITAVLDDSSGGGGQQRSQAGRAALAAGDPARAADRLRRARRGARAGAARGDRGRRRLRAARADQPAVSARLQRQDGRAADRDGRRRRLRPLLRDPLTRGASARARLARGARAHRTHLGAHRPRRRHDRGDRDGRPVHDRLRRSSTGSRAARSP